MRPIAPGDAFTIRADCDKRVETWVEVANVANFRGFPASPGQDAVLRYTRTGGGRGRGAANPEIVVAAARR